MKKWIWFGGSLALTMACVHTAPSTPPEWNQRLGNYKFDQAVDELGPPSQEKTLEGGARVCTWPMAGNTSKYTGPQTSYGTTTPGLQDSQFLILTFDSQNVLVNCVTAPKPPETKSTEAPAQ